MKYIIIIFTTLLVLQGCASIKIQPQQLERIQRIGAISLLGDKIEMLLVGTTVFNNKHYYREIGQGVDQKMRNLIREKIIHKMNYVDFDYDKDIIAQGYKYKDGTGFGRGFDIELIKPYLKDISKKYDLDALILVTRRRSGNRYGFDGIGYNLFTRSFFSKRVATIFTFQATYSIINLKTFESFARGGAYCTKDIPHEYWVDENSDMGIEKKEYIQNLMNIYMRRNVDIGLGEIGLVESKSKKDWSIGCKDCCTGVASDNI